MRWFAVFLSTVILWIYVTMPDVRARSRISSFAANVGWAAT
jgi:hypothetical protein